MNTNHTTERGAHLTPIEIDAHIAAARKLRAEVMAEIAGSLAARIRTGLHGLRAAPRPAEIPCHCN